MRFMIGWTAMLIGIASPIIGKEDAMKRASKWLDNIAWVWLTSMVLRWAVIGGVAGVVGVVIWRFA